MSNQYSSPTPVFQCDFTGLPSEVNIWNSGQAPGPNLSFPNPPNKNYFFGAEEYMEWNDTFHQLDLKKPGVYEIVLMCSIYYEFEIVNPSDSFGLDTFVEVSGYPTAPSARFFSSTVFWDPINQNNIVSGEGWVHNGANGTIVRLTSAPLFIHPGFELIGADYARIFQMSIYSNSYSFWVKRLGD